MTFTNTTTGLPFVDAGPSQPPAPTPDLTSSIRAGREMGVSWQGIADAVGMAKTTVYDCAIRNGLKDIKPSKKPAAKAAKPAKRKVKPVVPVVAQLTEADLDPFFYIDCNVHYSNETGSVRVVGLEMSRIGKLSPIHVDLLNKQQEGGMSVETATDVIALTYHIISWAKSGEHPELVEKLKAAGLDVADIHLDPRGYLQADFFLKFALAYAKTSAFMLDHATAIYGDSALVANSLLETLADLAKPAAGLSDADLALVDDAAASVDFAALIDDDAARNAVEAHPTPKTWKTVLADREAEAAQATGRGRAVHTSTPPAIHAEGEPIKWLTGSVLDLDKPISWNSLEDDERDVLQVFVHDMSSPQWNRHGRPTLELSPRMFVYDTQAAEILMLLDLVVVHDNASISLTKAGYDLVRARYLATIDAEPSAIKWRGDKIEAAADLHNAIDVNSRQHRNEVIRGAVAISLAVGALLLVVAVVAGVM